jgi:Ca-activated chloride channel family protein
VSVRRLLGCWLGTLTAALCLAGDVHVAITSPAAGVSVAGSVIVAAKVDGTEPVSHVEFRVDGRVAGRATAPPWELAVEVGLDNVEHRFEAVVVTAAGEAARAALVTPRIRVDEVVSVQLQQLYVTATRSDRRVLGLDRDDFTVYDDGEKQRLITFERGDVPFTAVILLDASSSMAGEKLRAAVDGARAFVGAMRELDEARIVAFSDRLLGATPFLTVGNPGAQSLDEVEASGGTALNDQLYAGLHVLEQRQGRRVVIMLSDGLDSHSVLAIDDVLPLAGRSRALLYWLRLVAGGPTSPDLAPGHQHSAWRDGNAHRRQIDALERAVIDSGGRVAIIHSAAEMAPTFAGILAELREQYVLGYYPSDARNDGAWHAVKVKSPFAGVELRTSTGYLDY